MSFTLLSVYNRRRARILHDLVDQATDLGGTVRLWALDEPADALAPWTVGSGKAPRCTLLNRLYAQAPADGDVVVADDDVAFARGDLGRFLEVFRRFGWDLAQPSHAWRGSNASYRFFSRRRPWLRGRDSMFVEIGPMFAVAERSRDLFLPLPDWGMGWGVELVWWDRAREGARLGIVDEVSMRHLSPLFGAYSRPEEEARLDAELVLRGLRSIRQIHQITDRTPRW